MSLLTKSNFQRIMLLLQGFSLILQFVLFKGNILNFFSYFTILSNLLWGIALWCSVFLNRTKAGDFLSGPGIVSAITLYLFIVGLVYNLVLRRTWDPQGWQWLADNLLHVVNPFLIVCFWSFYIEKGTLKWKESLNWLWFPLIYLLYSLARGHIVHWYPYPFLNVAVSGYLQVFINAGMVLITFVLFGSLLLWLDRVLRKV